MQYRQNGTGWHYAGTLQQAPDLPGFGEQFAQQSSWQWNFGQAPDFTHQLDTCFSWGGIELHLDIARGVITRSQMFTDSLNPTPFEALAFSLQGCDYRSQNVSQAGTALMAQFPEQNLELQQVTQWLAETIRYWHDLIVQGD